MPLLTRHAETPETMETRLPARVSATTRTLSAGISVLSGEWADTLLGFPQNQGLREILVLFLWYEEKPEVKTGNDENE